MEIKKSWEITLLSILAMVYTIYFAQAVLFPIFLAVVLYFLFGPLIRFLKTKSIPKTITSGLVIISFVSIISFLASKLTDPATEWIQKAPKKLRIIEKKISFIKEPIEKISSAAEKVEDIATMGPDAAKNIEVDVASQGFNYTIFDVTSNAFSTTIAILVILYFLLVYGDNFLRQCSKSLKSFSNGNGDMLKKIESVISRYLITFSCINICLALVIGLALEILNVPNAPLWGVMAGLLNFIPYIGPIVGSTVVLIVSILSFETTWQTILPPIAYFSINSLEGQVITPILIGKRLSLSPLVILMSMIFWGSAWGIKGALLSVPLLAIFKIVCDETRSLKHIGKILES